MIIRVINKSKNSLPAYETLHAAGMDLRADVESTVTLAPMERKLVPTGLHIELPEGFEAQIRPRSGLAFKFGIGIVNSPGTIDADYRGEIKVLLINFSSEVFEINTGDRIAQMVVAKHEKVDWEEVEVLNETSRGVGGYGHTGVS
ncbi:dUTP diphosphatase [Mucilaginibacter sp.]